MITFRDRLAKFLYEDSACRKQPYIAWEELVEWNNRNIPNATTLYQSVYDRADIMENALIERLTK